MVRISCTISPSPSNFPSLPVTLRHICLSCRHSLFEMRERACAHAHTRHKNVNASNYRIKISKYIVIFPVKLQLNRSKEKERRSYIHTLHFPSALNNRSCSFLLFFRDERMAGYCCCCFRFDCSGRRRIRDPFLLQQSSSKWKTECGNQKKATYTYIYCLCCSIVANTRCVKGMRMIDMKRTAQKSLKRSVNILMVMVAECANDSCYYFKW